MNTLLIGGGGRENALSYAIFHSYSNNKLFCAPGNPGISKFAESVDIYVNKHQEVIDFCKIMNIDLVVIGPEQPLADGLADSLRENNINVFGPSKKAARLESSKGFAKEFMLKHNIPTAAYKSFSLEEKGNALKYIQDLNQFPVVLKADGLAAGKGVVIAKNRNEAVDTLNSMFSGQYGEAGNSVVIEEFLIGEEASILAVTDGRKFVTLASSQDHKRIYDGDKGPNTGGMGAYSPALIVTDTLLEEVRTRILKPAIDGIADDGTPFIGCLYAGLMINDGTPKVVEFNVRFGDPETQAVLTNFRGDFTRLLHSAAIGDLDISAIDETSHGYSCCVVMASEGYPVSYPKGQIITGIDKAEKIGAVVYHAGTSLIDGELKVSGGRVLGVTGKGDSLKEAVDIAYSAVKLIHFDNTYYRKDIAAKAL
ncbi:phosphoribosylamine--glycine ligase [Bacteroidota bacterium]